MVGALDPRCETVRGTHWPKKGREVVWSSRRGNHLGQRSTDRINRPDIWMQAIRSDSEKLLWHGGRPHMGPCVRRDDKTQTPFGHHHGARNCGHRTAKGERSIGAPS